MNDGEGVNISIPLFKVHMPAGAGAALAATLASGQLAHGARVAEFERSLTAYTGNPLVSALSEVSGALTLALFMAGVRPEDEVIVSPMVCLATSMPIANLFARPLWCDVDPATGMLDPARIRELVTPRTRAILAYHWSGDVADLEALQTAARAHGLKLIEDASEASGAEYRGEKLGRDPRILAQQKRRLAQQTSRPKGEVFEVPDGRGDQMKRGGHTGVVA